MSVMKIPQELFASLASCDIDYDDGADDHVDMRYEYIMLYHSTMCYHYVCA